DLLNAGGAGNIDVAAYLQAVLKVGIDFSGLADGEFPEFFIVENHNDDGTRIEVGAQIVGSNLDLAFKVLGAELGVTGGSAYFGGYDGGGINTDAFDAATDLGANGRFVPGGSDGFAKARVAIANDDTN